MAAWLRGGRIERLDNPALVQGENTHQRVVRDGAMPLAEKLDVYHPGWFMDWTGGRPSLRMETVDAHRRLMERAAFPELDRYRNAGIVLYQIFPRGSQ